MSINEIVEYLNNSAKEYNEFFNNMAKVVNEINSQAAYRIDLEDRRPDVLFIVKALGIEVNIKKSDLKLIASRSGLNQEEMIIEYIMAIIKND